MMQNQTPRFDLHRAVDSLPSATSVLQLVASYDRLRLETYRDRGPRGESIRLASIGSATVLRCDDVGYFNRVYSPDEAVADRLVEIEAFYAGSPFACELLGPPAPDSVRTDSRIDRACGQNGWLRGRRHAWLAAPLGDLDPMAAGGADPFAVRPPARAEQERFLTTYLRAFEAAPGRFAAARANMRHLFELCPLSFLMAHDRGEPLAVGVFYRAGDAAVLCGGATLPSFRKRGCHMALIGARIRLASEVGCRWVVSWALAGGQSHANLGRAGLKTVGITSARRLPSSVVV